MNLPVAALAFISLLASLSVAAETHRFEPSESQDMFSFAHEPVLWIQPGYGVITETMDVRRFDTGN